MYGIHYKKHLIYEELLVWHYLQHYSGTTRLTETQCGFIDKSAVIKCHQLLSKVINGRLCFDQLATASCYTPP